MELIRYSVREQAFGKCPVKPQRHASQKGPYVRKICYGLEEPCVLSDLFISVAGHHRLVLRYLALGEFAIPHWRVPILLIGYLVLLAGNVLDGAQSKVAATTP